MITLGLSPIGVFTTDIRSTTPTVLQAPIVSPDNATADVALSATPGVYAPANGGALTIVQAWLLDDTIVATGPTFTPSPAQVGLRLRYRENVSEDDDSTDTLELTVFDSVIADNVAVSPPTALSVDDITATQGTGPITLDLAALFTGDDLTYTSDQPWATVSGTILTIADEVRQDSVTLTATNTAGSASVTIAVDISAGASVSDAFGLSDWQPSNPGTGDTATLVITNLPAANGSDITDLEYRINGGSWTSLGTAAPGTYTITGLEPDSELDFELRAINAIGAGAISAPQEVTVAATPITISAGSDYGILEINDIEGTIDVEIIQPSQAAGVYSINTDDITAGPVHLTTIIAGGDAVGDTKSIASSLWATEKSDGPEVLSLAWRTSETILSTAGTFTLTQEQLDFGLDVVITASNPAGDRTVELTLLSGGTTAAAPDTFEEADWSVQDAETGDRANLVLTALPAQNGAALTDIEYRVNGGTWISMGTTTTGTYGISGLTAGTSYTFELRALNVIGAALASPGQSVTLTPISSDTETGVTFGGDTELALTADLSANAGSFLGFISVTPLGDTRGTILSWIAGAEGLIDLWNGGPILRWRTRPIGAAISAVSSPILTVGQRASLLISAEPVGADVRIRAFLLQDGGTGWSEVVDTLVADASTLNLAGGQVSVGARLDSSRKLDATLYRTALWAGSDLVVPDISDPEVQSTFMASATQRTDPTASHAAFGTPLVDFNGDAAAYNSGQHDGSLPSFTLISGGVTDAT